MFTLDQTNIRWGSPDHTSYAVRVKQEADPDFFDAVIIRDDPNPEFAAMFDAIEAGGFDIGDYIPPPPLPMSLPDAAPYAPEDIKPDMSVAQPARRIELWRVKRALREVPATPAFREYVASSGVEVRGADGRTVEVDRLSGLDQISAAIGLTDNVSLQDFWRDGVYVYDNSPNFRAFAAILDLSPDEVDAMVTLANSFVV